MRSNARVCLATSEGDQEERGIIWGVLSVRVGRRKEKSTFLRVKYIQRGEKKEKQASQLISLSTTKQQHQEQRALISGSASHCFA